MRLVICRNDYQFVGKKGDKNTLERHFEDTNG